MKNTSAKGQRGAVSLFAVIFAMLLISVITVSFIRLMLNDQQQATNNDLSQSAYDSAMAGVEDAKRSLLRYKEICKTSDAECARMLSRYDSGQCNAAVVGVAGVPLVYSPIATFYPEVPIEQTATDGSSLLNQAYTCVTVGLDTKDYEGSASANISRLIPLFADRPFTRIQIEWYSTNDLSSGVSTINLPTSTQALSSTWPANRPPVLRAQLMQYGTNFTLAQFDAATAANSNTNTLFLYPSGTAASSTPTSGVINMLTADVRTSDPANESPADGTGRSPYAVRCLSSLPNGGYSCKAVIQIPNPVGGTEANRTAYLRLTPFYKGTEFRISLLDGATIVDFDGVQPEIDSTGRANDLFRRVRARVDMFNTAFPYPEAAVDLTGNFCKDFSVTDTEYRAGTPACTP